MTTFNLNYGIPELLAIVKETDHKVLARWAIDCVERVIHFYEAQYPNDSRPRDALRTLQNWIDSGEFKMSVIRGASLASHAAAREVGADTPARSAARSAGQAVATAHVPTHSIGAANYALQAIYRAAEPGTTDTSIAQERKWQYQHLIELKRTLS